MFYVVLGSIQLPLAAAANWPFIYSRPTGQLDQRASWPQLPEHNGQLANCIAAAVLCMFERSSCQLAAAARSNWQLKTELAAGIALYGRFARQKTSISAKWRSVYVR